MKTQTPTGLMRVRKLMQHLTRQLIPANEKGINPLFSPLFPVGGVNQSKNDGIKGDMR